MKLFAIPLALACIFAAASVPAADAALKPHSSHAPFVWQNATIYFLLTDRFYNGNPANDLAYGRRADAAPLRGFMGGDLAGITAKIKAGYFKDLGVDVIWLTPPVEQIHGSTDEGTGNSYGFHGYWARDWTRVDANLGTEDDMREFVDTAHAHGIRVLLDVVMNHMGPVTAVDPVWPDNWVRTGPPCTYKDIASTVDCTLVKNLPDLLTGSNENVALPPALIEKWKSEGRYEREMKELDEFFIRTAWPRAPRYYLMKWHADWVKKFGVDGFRADTVKHVEPAVWKELKQVASAAYEEWKSRNPKKKLGDEPFFMTAEAYGYGIADGLQYRMDGGARINFYDHGFDSLINFGFKSDANKAYEALFSDYSAKLNGPLKAYSVLNYISSHDDGGPFDQLRQRPLEAATKLLLSPGAAQIYYGDETARVLLVPGAEGDATLRSVMNWEELKVNTMRNGYSITEIRRHWSKLGLFRHAHPAVGAGVHQKLADQPYTFKRTYEAHGISDKVVVALDVPSSGNVPVSVAGVFADGQKVKDYYSGTSTIVVNGKAKFPSKNAVILIGQE
ncbi:alpha-amylase [Undibacterium sp. Jales W-56]|uniref:alpha-amylase family glycosyl hydrolase n=1 Tax=Undibacterium sp. Jales W-56 TaxID=2897325 RepID=UPI0021CEAC2D|nr:alpha-amylase family glycosyl hydrolase [Undibacterium sp. Jales W-56]MCU6434516.1 alpha-amylase [Undibacterium sp. Jales W-56]